MISTRDQRLLNCGARRAALRPYSPDFSRNPCNYLVFEPGYPPFPHPLTTDRISFLLVILDDPLLSPESACGFNAPSATSEALRTYHLVFRVNVHSNLAVLVTGKALHRLRICSGMNPVGDIDVPQLVRCDLEIQATAFSRFAHFCPGSGLNFFWIACPFCRPSISSCRSRE